MSVEAAKAFLVACDTDAKVEEAVRDLMCEEHDSFEVIAAMATGLGFEFTAKELAVSLAEKATDMRATLDGQELSDEELVQVAGGGVRPECSSDFDPKDTCYFDDRCMRTWCYYKKNTECATTYDWVFDNCYFSDRCSTGTNTYLAN